MNTIETILRSQENLTGSTERKSTSSNVARSSAEELIGALLVFEDGNLYGILPGSTYFRKMILVKDALQQTWLMENVTQMINGGSPEQVVEKCLALSQEKGIQHLPVIVEERLIGIISMEDLANVVLTDIY